MTTEQEKALAIIKGIEATSGRIYGQILELESDLEDPDAKKRRSKQATLNELECFHRYAKGLVAEIEKAFGIAYKCTEEVNFSVASPFGFNHNVQQKVMERVDGERRIDYKITTSYKTLAKSE